jgi:hypothetical protein
MPRTGRDAGAWSLVAETLVGALTGVLCAAALFAGCEGGGGGGAAGDAGASAGDGADVPVGSGPPAACGGVQTGDWWEAGGVGEEGRATFELRVGGEERPLDLIVRTGSDIVMVGFLNERVPAEDRPRWGADRQTIRIGPIGPPTVSDAAVSGAIFARLNNKFGGNIAEGRLCLDAPPQTGQPLTGSWVFVLDVGLESAVHRVQGTFAVPGDAVTVGPGDALAIDARLGATIVVE